jgi:hypothetical protein
LRWEIILPLDVFISHSHQDHLIAGTFVNFLNTAVGLEPKNIRCTSYLPTSLSAGGKIEEELRRDIKRCELFMPLITANTLKSEFVLFEIGAAWIQEKEIIPVVYGETSSLRLPSLLSGLHCTDISGLDGLVKLAEHLSKEFFYAKDRTSAEQKLVGARAFLALLSSGFANLTPSPPKDPAPAGTPPAEPPA